MSLAGAEPPDPDHLRRFAALVCRVQPVQVSEHLAWSRLGARYEPDLLPFVRNAQSLQRVVNQLHPVEGHLLAPTSPTEGRWRVQGDAGTVEVPIESSACRARRPPARFLTRLGQPAPLRTPPTGADHAVPPGPAACGQLHRPHRGQHGRRVAAVHQGRVRRLPRCGILAHGFLRLRCGECGHDKLLAFSCKRRGFCPSCGARRMSQTAAHLVDHVIPHVPVRQWVLSLPIPLRVLLAAQPELVTPVLQVVQRVVTRHLLRQAGLKADEGHGGAVTLIQRFGSAANLNIHLHCLVLDGVYCCDADGSPAFIEADAPNDDELHALLQTVIARLMKMLTRRGVLVEDMGQTYLAEPDADGEEARTLQPLQAAAITYRIAFGPRVGQKVLTLRGAMPREDSARQPLCADIDGFSLHAAVRVEAHDRKRLEQLCRYITRPALSDERVQVNAAGQVELKLKTPWRDGTTHLVSSPLEFMQRLAALVPRPRLHLIRFHGVLAPNAKLRSLVVPQGPEVEERATAAVAASECVVQTETNPDRPDRPHRIAWARLLKRGVRHRHAALPQLRRRGAQDHRGHPGATGDREDPAHLGLDPQPPPRGRRARRGKTEAA